jgi:endonuclease/exonuclease/phosphatase family metal-dependent hydrolase
VTRRGSVRWWRFHALRVLTWNLYHGRAQPPAGRELWGDFSARLAGWDWDVALLQEVPPWWAGPLAEVTNAQQRRVLTSRNSFLALRRAVAVRRPDLIKSNGGGANVILVRDALIRDHRTARLELWPERRWLQAVSLDNGMWVANLHTGPPADHGIRASELLREWSAGQPAVLGGDFNVPPAQLEAPLARQGFAYAGGSGTDLVFAAGLPAAGPVRILDRGTLSDHTPVVVGLVESTPGGAQTEAAQHE